jgi:hypothetical protein
VEKLLSTHACATALSTPSVTDASPFTLPVMPKRIVRRMASPVGPGACLVLDRR